MGHDHSYVRHDSFIHVTWLIHTHSWRIHTHTHIRRNDLFTHIPTREIYTSHTHNLRLLGGCVHNTRGTWHIHMTQHRNKSRRIYHDFVHNTALVMVWMYCQDSNDVIQELENLQFCWLLTVSFIMIAYRKVICELTLWEILSSNKSFRSRRDLFDVTYSHDVFICKISRIRI